MTNTPTTKTVPATKPVPTTKAVPATRSRTVHRIITTAVATVTVIALAGLLAGCAPGPAGPGEPNGTNTQTSTGKDAAMTGAKDAAGMTLAQVQKLSLEEEFALVGERYAKGNALLTEAQLQISDGVWLWGVGGPLPNGGYSGGVGDPLPGSDGPNSYYLTAGRIIRPPGAVGAKEDLEPMRAYYESKGWKTRLQEVSGDYYLWGITGDGYQLEYGVQKNGQYYIRVYTELFWTNDSSTLLRTIASRVSPGSAGSPGESLPGVFEPFPKWEDPIVNPPKT